MNNLIQNHSQDTVICSYSIKSYLDPIFHFSNDRHTIIDPLIPYIENLTINPRTGKRLIVLAIISANYISMSKNFFCSLENAGDFKDYLLFITESELGKIQLEAFGAKVCCISSLLSKTKKK